MYSGVERGEGEQGRQQEGVTAAGEDEHARARRRCEAQVCRRQARRRLPAVKVRARWFHMHSGHTSTT